MKSLDAVGLMGQQQYISKNMDNTHFVFLDRLQDAQMVMATVAAK
jgi:hypothetical protein